jgi:hypothetical protein
MAATAVWTIHFSNQRNIAALGSRIETVRPLARELAVDDPTQIAVVKLQELWYDENRWDLYLPPSPEKYQICLATRDIPIRGLIPPAKSALLTPGRHRIELEQQQEGDIHRVTITWGGTVQMFIEEPKKWYPGRGSSGGSEISNCEHFPSDKPLVLFRRRFSKLTSQSQSTTPAGPTEGVLLWIEPIAGSSGQSAK